MAKSEPYAQRRRRDPSPCGQSPDALCRELLESRHLRIKFIDEQGRLFVDDEQQQPQPVHGLTSSDEHPQACCELCRQPVAKKAGYADSPVGGKMVAKSDPRTAFRAVLDSTIALAVWLQIELAEPWQPWLADIRSRLGNIMRADALGNRWAIKRLSGFLTKICIGFLTSRCVISTTIIWCRKPATGAMRRC